MTNGKTAWITGASSGIGRALALRLARDGWHVSASARNGEALASLAEEARAAGGTVVPVALDATNRDAVRAAAAQIVSTSGVPDLAIFGAGTWQRDSAARFDTDALRGMVDLNIMGTAYSMETMIAPMLTRGSGHIAVIASVAGYNGLPGAAFYGATKAALNNMCESLVPELAEGGVTLSIVNPGFVETPLTAGNDFPMPFIIGPEEAADHIVRGLAGGGYEIIFPWRMALAIRLLHALPQALRFAITRRMLRANRSDDAR